MNVSPAIRAAIAAGTSAGLVVSLMMFGQGRGDVAVHNTAAEATTSTVPDDTTTTTAAESTTTTAAQSTTTTAAAPTTTAPGTPLSERVTKVEQRVDVIEATTTSSTTTTTTAPVAPTSIPGPESAAPDGWTISFKFYNHAEYATTFPNPRIRFTYTTGTETIEQTVAIPAGDRYGGGTVTVHLPGVTGPVQPKVVAVEWDGGSLPGGSGQYQG